MTARLAMATSMVLAGMLGGAVQAQSGPEDTAPPPTPEQPPATTGGGPSESQLAEAQKVVSRGTRLSSQVSAMKGESERSSDIIKVGCLQKILTEVNANLRAAQSRMEGLRAEKDPARVNQSMTVLLVMGQKFDVLDQQASQCIGQNVFEVGSTKVETEIDNSTVPTEQEAQIVTVPEIVPPVALGQVQVETPPTPEEASPNGDEG